MATLRYGEEEEVWWLQASQQASPETNYCSSDGLGSRSGLHWQYPASAGSSPSWAQASRGTAARCLTSSGDFQESTYELSLRDIIEHHPSPSSLPHAPPSPSPLAPPSTVRRHHTTRAAVPVPVPMGAQEKKDEPTVVAAATDDEDSGGSKQGGKKYGRKQRTMMRKQRSWNLERSVSLDTSSLVSPPTAWC
ncbi:hypothetical protein BDA96_08G185000 [Sorghum bicolor]|uniref:Uncharacterized protein n=2 Tax=Sorghum bicolor TaxID=4558 RepID=A0A921QHK0_SORBI|nr:hypothetical protein BDA96_08G185000 [Sorghum bicolor]OQU79593.1 hypothetical protein SORBI_3008G167401 [Sorghum bicolor]